MAHLDCDAFYASVEKRDRPDLRDAPVIVGGGRRGVVATACYLARQFGVKSAMPMFKARRLCPDAVVLKPDFARYRAESQRIFGWVRALTPLVQQLSLDEAWIDLSGTETLNGGPAAWQLARLQTKIEAETGLTVSIGLSTNRFLAKLASDLDKPRGFTAIGSEARRFLADKPVRFLPGVGPRFADALTAAGYARIGDLAQASETDLTGRFGEWGARLKAYALGLDDRPVDPESGRKGMSAETTFDSDLADLSDLEAELWPLCEKLARKARRENVSSRVVVLKLRTTQFRSLTRRRTLPHAIATARSLFSQARSLLAAEADGRRFRLIGVGFGDLEPLDLAQDDLFGGEEAKNLKRERTVDLLRRRFGDATIVEGRSLGRGQDRRSERERSRRVAAGPVRPGANAGLPETDDGI